MLLLSVVACDRPPPQETKNEDAANAASSVVPVIRLEGGDWGYPSPFAHYPRGPGGFKMALIFDSLLERDEKGLIPWLAENYSIDEDGKTYRFQIRQGVRWQDGTSLTPEDVAFSLEYANRHAATWSYIEDALETVDIDGDTVVVRLKQPQAIMLESIGRTRIIPKHIWEDVDNPKEFTTPEAAIGCGPYRLTDYSKAHGTYRFEANPDYWGPKPRVQGIEFVPVSESILAYESGELDMVAVPADVLSRFTSDPGNRIVRNPAFWGRRLLLNMSKVAALGDVRVRKALAYGIDRDELVEKIERGAAVPGSLGILPPDHVMAAEDVKSYAFDPDQARELLAEAGYVTIGKDGIRLGADGEPLAAELLCASAEVRIAELIRQRLGDIGVGLTIRSVDSKTRDANVRSREYQLAIIGHGGWGGDPSYIATHLVGDVFEQNAAPSASGIEGLEAPELFDLLHRQAVEIDPTERKQLIEKIQVLAAELVPEIPLYCTAGWTAYRPAVYDGWMNMFDHHSMSHSKLSYLERTGPAAKR
jgi:peptide/nickel transport system substrate-binding protein